jgi:hypothetical protein
MLATPARLQPCFGAGDVTVERLDGFRLEIDGAAETGAGGPDNKDEKELRQLQSAPTGFLAAASTTSR